MRVEYNKGQEIGNCVYLNEEIPLKRSNGKNIRRAKFLCKCGKEFISCIWNVVSLKTNSCGCFRTQRIREKNYVHGAVSDKIGSGYNIWLNIKQRCFNKKNESYKRYGAIGIKMSKRWERSYMTFINDMGPRPSKEHSIDRKDNKKGYFKSNCRWATNKEQANNKTINVYVLYKKKIKTLSQWCDEYDISYKATHHRVKSLGWSFEDALKRGMENKNGIIYKHGKPYNQ